MELIYDHPACKIYEPADNVYIHTEWLGFSSSAAFREIFEKILSLVKEKQVSKVLFEGSKSKLASPDDQKWLIEDWTPRAVVAGYKYYSVVLPKDVFGQFSSKIVIQQTDSQNPIFSATTDNVEEAIAWLIAQ